MHSSEEKVDSSLDLVFLFLYLDTSETWPRFCPIVPPSFSVSPGKRGSGEGKISSIYQSIYLSPSKKKCYHKNLLYPFIIIHYISFVLLNFVHLFLLSET